MDNDIEDVYKQMPAIVTYYLADKFVNLSVHHRRRFWVAYGIMIIYVKYVPGFCFLQVSYILNPISVYQSFLFL